MHIWDITTLAMCMRAHRWIHVTNTVCVWPGRLVYSLVLYSLWVVCLVLHFFESDKLTLVVFHN